MCQKSRSPESAKATAGGMTARHTPCLHMSYTSPITQVLQPINQIWQTKIQNDKNIHEWAADVLQTYTRIRAIFPPSPHPPPPPQQPPKLKFRKWIDDVPIVGRQTDRPIEKLVEASVRSPPRHSMAPFGVLGASRRWWFTGLMNG